MTGGEQRGRGSGELEGQVGEIRDEHAMRRSAEEQPAEVHDEEEDRDDAQLPVRVADPLACQIA